MLYNVTAAAGNIFCLNYNSYFFNCYLKFFKALVNNGNLIFFKY